MIPMEGGTQGSLQPSTRAGIKGSAESTELAREDTILSPNAMFTHPAASDIPKLRRYAAMTLGEATAARNDCQFMPAVLRKAAESGTITISPR